MDAEVMRRPFATARLKAFAKRIVRGVVRRLVPIVSRRPWLVGLAGRAFVVFPTLKLRLRHMVSQPVAVPEQHLALDDAQTRVLLDLQDAVRAQENTR